MAATSVNCAIPSAVRAGLVRHNLTPAPLHDLQLPTLALPLPLQAEQIVSGIRSFLVRGDKGALAIGVLWRGSAPGRERLPQVMRS